ncbi:unnamed protein product [Bemisia tabaci]|uniref:V-type proton ATPase subunit S1/VOA1 transmembrane domain-containing protein n=1 Tax=Bemisia tabaci TaxID=7038 RepID=A0A9P0F2U3_BEMTA|nr:unnamed protein product [Bemisia tabaci]
MRNLVTCSLLWLLVNVLSSAISESSVPVLLWESKNSGDHFHTVPALAEYDRDEFLNHFLKKIKNSHSKPLIVAFLEDTLSLEDFSWQDSSKKQAFEKIQKLVDQSNGIEFLPAVKSVDDALQKLEGYGYSQKNFKDLQGDEEGVFSFVRFDDGDRMDEDRPDMLNRHDELMAEAVKKLSSSQRNCIFVLSGKEPSWIEPQISESLARMRRALQAVESNGTVADKGQGPFLFNASGQVLLQTQEAPVLIVDGEKVVLPPTHDDQLDTRPDTLRLISTFKGTDNGKKLVLRFIFKLSSNVWTLTSVDYTYDNKDGSLTPTTPIRAGKGFAYLDISPHTFTNEDKSITLSFKNLKTQAWTRGTFSQAESKVGFFTIPIWTGILVVGMLALIMVWGLIMVLDIKTMDQFDDPKGKTISINASE